MKKSHSPDFNLASVSAVTIGAQKFRVVSAIGPAHLVIEAPRDHKWPSTFNIRRWPGRVKGFTPNHTLYFIAASGLVLHRGGNNARS